MSELARRVHAITRPDRKLLVQFVLLALLTGPGFFIVILPLYFRYHTLRYRFDDEGVAMSWGILWRREVYLTYARIQDIHLTRGLLERWLGLATIEVQTAAGSSSAEMTILGLIEYETVRDYLYERMRGAEATAAEATPDADHQAVALLTEVRDELRRIREQLEAR